MTSTPDTSITIPSTGNVADGQAWQVRVYRGIDATTPLDVAAVSATGTGTTRFDAPAITPTTAGAWIMIGGGGAASASTTALGTPSGFSGWGATNGADTNDGSCGAGYYSGWSSGSYNPAAPTTGGSVNAVNSWAAWTIALRPDPNQTLTPSLFTNSNSLALAHTVSGSGGGSGATYSTAGSGGSSVSRDHAGHRCRARRAVRCGGLRDRAELGRLSRRSVRRFARSDRDAAGVHADRDHD